MSGHFARQEHDAPVKFIEVNYGDAQVIAEHPFPEDVSFCVGGS